MVKWLWLLLLAMASFGFGQGDALRPPVRGTVLAEGLDSRIRTAQQRIISTRGEWQLVWRDLTGNDPATAPGDINWAREQLVLIATGERRTGGFRVMFRGVTWADVRTLEVGWTESAPGPGDRVSRAFTYPYMVVRIDSRAPVRFRRDSYIADTTPPPTRPGWGWGGDDFPRPVRWALLDRGPSSAVSDRRVFIFANAQEFRRYFERAFPGRELDSGALDAIRWDEDVVVALHFGRTATPGATVEIQGIMLERTGRVTVTAFEGSDPNFRGFGWRQPYLILRMPRYSSAPRVNWMLGRPL